MALLLRDPFFDYRPRLLDTIEDEFFNPLSINPWRQLEQQICNVATTPSTISFDENKFQANIDVQQFKPEEITVKITDDNTVTVEGKHEEKPDEHGFISRQFVRRYVLPEGHDISRVESKLSSDGVLTITAPKIESKGENVKTIPITCTGKPSRIVHKKKDKRRK